MLAFRLKIREALLVMLPVIQFEYLKIEIFLSEIEEIINDSKKRVLHL